MQNTLMNLNENTRSKLTGGKCRTFHLNSKFFDSQVVLFDDVGQMSRHRFSFQAGVKGNSIVLGKQVHKDTTKIFKRC